MKIFPLLVIGFLLWSCSNEYNTSAESTNVVEQNQESSNEKLNKIQVLNFGTFHMSFTTDANKTAFDENDKDNQKAVHEIAQKLAAFKPTVIIVETRPENDEQLQASYSEYIDNPDKAFQNPSEVELLAFELGRLSNTKRIYGIDHKMGYNYLIAREIENQIDSALVFNFYNDPLQYYPEVNVNEDSLNLFEKLKVMNHDEYLDFLITVNADIMAHVGTNGKFEGADEAAKYYQRNLRMFTNLNRIDLNETDRVFILMGASHTAFFRDFMSRSPKYEMVHTFDYLK